MFSQIIRQMRIPMRASIPFVLTVDCQNAFTEKPLHVLLIEDSEVDALLFESCFRRSELGNAEISVSRTLADGIGSLVANPVIDAVFLDLNLPDSPASDTLQRLLPYAGSRPIIILSIESDQALIRAALRSGAQDYLVKGAYDPVRIEHALMYSLERMRVTAALRKTHENYETLFQNNPMPGWLFHPTTLQIVMVNDAAIRHYGYTREEFTSMTIRDLRPVEDLVRFDQFIHSIKSLQYTSAGDNWRHQKKDGTQIDVEISGQVVTINDEILIYAVVRDITERNRIMRVSEENSRRLDLAVSAGRMMMLDVDYLQGEIHLWCKSDGILGFPVDIVSKIETTLDFVLEEDRVKIRTALEIGRTGKRHDLQFRIIHPVSKAVIWVERRSYLEFDQDGRTVQSRGVLVEITALKQYEEQLIESYKQLELAAMRQGAILDSLPAHIALLDKEGGIVAVNEAWSNFARYNGYTSDEGWTGKSYFTHADGDAEIERIHNGIRSVLEGSVSRFDVEYPCHSPTEKRWFRASACAIDTVNRRGAVIMHIDITERKRVEDELLQSRANLLSIFESTEDSYLLIDPEYRVLTMNARARVDFSYLDVPDIAGQELMPRVPEERRALLLDALEVACRKREPAEYEMVIENDSDQSRKYFQVRVSPVQNGSTLLGYTLCGHDITPHIRIQQALADSEQKFRSLIENSGDMFTITDRENRIVYASPNIEKILGYSVDQVVGRVFTDLLHQEDRPYYSFIAEQAVRRKGKLFDESCRMETSSGEQLWTEGTVIDLSDVASVGGIVTNFRNITEKVHTQRQLDQNRYILDKANEVSKVGYWVEDLNAETKPLSWSPQLFRIFGVDVSDFTSEAAFLQSLIHEEDRKDRDAALERALGKDREYGIDYRVTRPDGELMWVHEQAEVFFNGEKPDFIVAVVQDITERKASEQKIRQSKHNLDALINNTSDFMWSCDQDLRLISANSAFFGQVRAEYEMDLKEGDRVILLSEDHPLMRPWQIGYRSALSGKQTIFETHRERGEQRVYFQNTLNPIWDNGVVVGVAGFSRNITENRIFENRIKAINERFEILSKATNDAVWDFDMRASLITWNHGLTSIYGYEPDNRQTTFDWWRDRVHPDDLKFVSDGLQNAFQNRDQLWSCSYRFLSGDGLYRYTLDRGFIIYDDVVPVRMIGAQQDVHELTEYRMSLEQKVQERTIELQEALQKEKQLSQMKSRFVSIASHEFRTPLSTIQFATDFLSRYRHKLAAEDIERKLESISSQVRHMLVLLDDVLTIGKADSGKIQVRLSPMNVQEFILELVNNVKHGSKTHHEIAVDFDMSDAVITTDEKLLMNILSNLLSNAIKFSPAGKHIRVYCGKEEGKLILEVADNGIGVNEEEKEMIFEPFSRGSHVGAISGSGLGLSIVRTAVKLLGGAIELRGSSSFRTVFRVELPLV